MSFLNCKELPTRFSCKSKIRTANNVDFNIIQKAQSKFTIKDSLLFLSNIKTKVSGKSNIQTITNLDFNPYKYVNYLNGRIQSIPVVSGVIRSSIDVGSKIPDITVDKFAGKLNFNAYEKLYPIRDISFTDISTNLDVSNLIQSDHEDVYATIDEGVILNQYTQNKSVSYVASDDDNSKFYIDNLLNDNHLEYKFEVTTPVAVAKESYFAIRTSSPTADYINRIPSFYKIYDIKLEDPYGNLIIQYNDIEIRGDNYYTTYISKQQTNNLLLPTWDANYPMMEESQDYTLRFKLGFDCEENAFTDKFNLSFEQGCIKYIPDATNPLKNLHISSIEIGNSGGVGILKDNYLGLWSLSAPSKKVIRYFVPTELLTSSFTNNIYPESTSIWESYPSQFNNENIDGSLSGLSSIVSPFETRYISLISSDLHPESGKLVLKFTNKHATLKSLQYIDGGFRTSFGGGSFSSAKPIEYQEKDIYFNAESVKLEIFAKKASNDVPDFPLDIVGYSDDKILCVTSSVGGFLQNDKSIPYESNEIPDISGINSVSNAISENPLSYDSDFYQRDISIFGDHYHITSEPLVDSTDFKKYTVPLQIYYDDNILGKKQIFSLSNFFDNLYIDIAPLPVGAVISHIRLVVEHNPSDALCLTTIGTPSSRKLGTRDFTLIPSKDNNNPVNKAGIITNIPQGFTSPNNLKTNYSRRWRGITNDILYGDFSPIEFNNHEFKFSFNTNPFLYGYVNFANYQALTNDIKATNNSIIAKFVTSNGTRLDDYLYQNIGWRLSSDQLFDNNPTTPYKSISWNSNIYDAFDRAVRVSGINHYISLGDVPLSPSGWAIFLRFTPDNTIPDNQCILSRIDGSNVKIKLKYNVGNLFAEADNGNVFVETGLYWDECQYPLSVLLTYNDDGENRLKIYADNELDDNFTHLLGQSEIFDYYDSSNNLNIGHCELSGDEDLPMFIHEFGISNDKCNLVQSLDPNLSKLNQELTIGELFQSHRMHFWQNGDANDRSDQYQYIDDDVSKWKLGAFKICSFNSDFDSFTDRDGDNYLMHYLHHNGKPYSDFIDKAIPNNLLLDGIAYHTQVENDFLRFNLSDIPTYNPSVFYASKPRISKNLPQNYNFNEESICVDTIIEYETNNNIIWDNGNTGAKFIVSLYSPILNNPDRLSKDFGLINRSIHYLQPSGCYQKLVSTFNFNDLIDSSEPWALFDKEIYSKEFKERFFSTELNDMFLQYDLVYPSGNEFEATLKIHNANVRLDKALGYYTNFQSDKDQELYLYCSGYPYSQSSLSFVVPNISTPIFDSGLCFYTSGDIFTAYNDLALSTLTSDGYYVQPQYISLFKNAKGVIDTFNNFGSNLFGSSTPTIGFFTSGEFLAEKSLSMYVSGEGSHVSDYVSMYNFGRYGFGYYDFQVENALNLSISAFDIPDFISTNNIGLHISGYQSPITVTNECPIFISGYYTSLGTTENTVSLFTVNYELSSSANNKILSINWNSSNPGQETLLIDQEYLYVDQDDNIRGVDIICYGDCSIYNVGQCKETPVTIHGDTWYDNYCVDGGIFRPKTTYTNLVFQSGIFRHNNEFISEIDPSTEEQTIFYSGHYYGTRKFTGLAANFPYNVTIHGKTGSSESIEIPREFVEVEYNKLEEDYVDIDGVTSLMDYNGISLVSNDEYRIPASQFGKSVAIKDDILIIGSPLANITYTNSQNELVELPEAGTVFVYKREPRPSGYEWPVDKFKSPWILDTTLSLPGELKSDYSLRLPEDNILIDYNRSLYAQKTRWFTGQEGRHFGHSIDIAKNGSKEIIVVGGPSAKFSRQFDDSDATVVNLGLCIFIDKFEKTTFIRKRGVRGLVELTYLDIIDQIQNKDLIFDYFSRNPKARFNFTIILYITLADSVEKVDVSWDDAPSSIPLKIVVHPISRNNPEFTVEQNYTRILEGLKEGFNKAFPINGDERFNGIPPILGLYIDSSESFIGAIPDKSLQDFITFYQNKAFENGMFELDPPASGQVSQFFTDNEVQAENWILLATGIVDDLLDFNNLESRQQIRFITGELGDPPPGTTRSEYNIPPDSGGRVYIFQNENNSWNLIQEIRSPNISYNYPDQFGHCVSISSDTELIGIGSPYIDEAVSLFEYKPDETQRYYNGIYNWINADSARVFKYTEELDNFASNNDVYKLYLSLSPEDKFKSRLELNINEYQKIYNLNHSHLTPIGSWSFIPNETAPSTRLGYSLDINSDGSKVVIGAPTDSMNLYNDADVYYAYNRETVPGGCEGNYRVSYYGSIPGIESCWASSVNAGSVYVLESRKYYPHDTVMEYGRFGNLHRRLSEANPESEDNGHFDYIEQIFEDKVFIRTGQSVNEIPQEVGLLFIITPEEDVLSDEVVENIINWLSLGDRNLVLVGNDPLWEANGAYKISNDVINKLLRRLNSRMQLKPAKNKFESAHLGYTDFDNIVTSHLPYGSTPTYINRKVSLRGSGVADIKMYYGDGSQDYAVIMEQDCREVSTCADPDIKYQIQDKCEMPLAHGGDLRAEWKLHCCNDRGQDYIYYQNWPLFFGSYTPQCADEESEPNPLANREAIPLLTVAEKIQKTVTVPPVPAKYGTRLIFDDLIVGQEQTRFFDPDPEVFENNEISFAWTNDIFPSSLDLNVTKNVNSTFINPTGEGILKGTGALRINDISYESKLTIDELSRFCVSQKYLNNNVESEVVLIAGVALESAASLDGLTGIVDTDKNIKFYRELVKNKNMLAQLALWQDEDGLQPATFQNAYSESIIADILKNMIKLRQGVNINKLLDGDLDLNGVLTQFDVAWISNVAKYDNINPTTINSLKSWLNRGNKKLVITFDYYQESNFRYENLNKVTSLCQSLGLTIKPLSYKGRYQESNGDASVLSLDSLNKTYTVSPIGSNYNPIDATGNSVKTISFQETPIQTDITLINNDNYWYMNTGTAKASFPAKPNTGYRLFFKTKKYDDDIKQPLNILIGNATEYPKSPIQDELQPISLMNFNDEFYLEEFTPNNPIVGNSTPINITIDGIKTIDVQVGNGKNSIDIYVFGDQERLNLGENTLTPETLTLVAISGIEINIETTISTTVVPGGGDFKGTEEYLISEAIPGYEFDLDFIRPISHLSEKYCTSRCSETGLGSVEIEDGPIVAAQELEIITAFAAGYNRSRITLLSDSSLIQGKLLKDGNSLSSNAYSFIRSLYPETYFETENYGRQFNIRTKIISPERGSPTKYLNYDGSLSINKNFANANTNGLTESIDHFQYESQYDPKLIRRPDNPWKCHDEKEKIEEVRLELISGFYSEEYNKFGCFPRFSGVINNYTYMDVGITGGIPEIMIREGYDYLDLDKFTGYPGDLFGYSVAIQDDIVLVGSPFAAFNNKESISSWTADSEFYLGEDGGPGAVYMFKKTGQGSGINNTLIPWECIRKFRPDSLMGQLSGINNYSDQFGHSVAIKNDIIAIGAPNHDYSTHYTIMNPSGEFVRKSFDESFVITKRAQYDLGNSGIRYELNKNDMYGNNAGAIYTYENKITDWENKIQNWTQVEKITANNDVTGNENERFGKTIYLEKTNRSDSDYTLIAGCETGSFEDELNVGIVYNKDIMVRHNPPATPNENSNIFIKLIGKNDSSYPPITLSFANNKDNSKSYFASGIIRSTRDGEIFLEVSGQDPSTKGFIIHRPYVDSIVGSYKYGKFSTDNMTLFAEGTIGPSTGNLPLFVSVENSGNVYNNLGLYNCGISGFSDAILGLYSHIPEPNIIENDSFVLYVSGIL